jgi:methionyl-tRNA formyltransferase
MEVEIAELKKENSMLREELEKIKEQLNRYVAPERHKTYYENNKEKIKQRVRDYQENTNYHSKISAEKKKQYARTAYLNKKAKLEKSNVVSDNI